MQAFKAKLINTDQNPKSNGHLSNSSSKTNSYSPHFETLNQFSNSSQDDDEDDSSLSDIPRD